MKINKTNSVKALLLKLKRLKIKCVFNEDESIIEIGGNAHNKLMYILSLIGVSLLMLTLLVVGLMFVSILALILFIVLLLFFLKYLGQKTEQGKNKFTVGPGVFSVFEGNTTHSVTELIESNLLVDCDNSNQIETIISGTLTVNSASLSNATIVSIIGEDKRLVQRDLEDIKKTILEIYNQG